MFFKWLIRARRLSRLLAAQAETFGLAGAAVSIRFVRDDGAWSDALVTRHGARRFGVTLSSANFRRNIPFARDRLPSVIHCLSSCPDDAGAISIDYSDGDRPSNASFCWSANDPARALLPDPHFFNARGYANARNAAKAGADWVQRSDIIRWRGGPNGAGAASADLRRRWDPQVMQRARLCMIASQINATDVRILPHADARDDLFGGKGSHLTGNRIKEMDWLGDKYAIDIDGHTNSWSNFLIRLHLGCCVFKVASQFGYRQWYYDRIRPFEHYIPVQADMRDLAEQIDWARSNPARAREIAREGQAFARSMTFESETAFAVNAISARQHA